MDWRRTFRGYIYCNIKIFFVVSITIIVMSIICMIVAITVFKICDTNDGEDISITCHIVTIIIAFLFYAVLVEH